MSSKKEKRKDYFSNDAANKFGLIAARVFESSSIFADIAHRYRIADDFSCQVNLYTAVEAACDGDAKTFSKAMAPIFAALIEAPGPDPELVGYSADLNFPMFSHFALTVWEKGRLVRIELDSRELATEVFGIFMYGGQKELECAHDMLKKAGADPREYVNWGPNKRANFIVNELRLSEIRETLRTLRLEEARK